MVLRVFLPGGIIIICYANDTFLTATEDTKISSVSQNWEWSRWHSSFADWYSMWRHRRQKPYGFYSRRRRAIHSLWLWLWIGEEYPPDRWNYEVPRSHLAFVVLMSTSAIWFNLRGSNHSLPLIAKYREIRGKYSLPLCMKHCFIWCLRVDLMTNLRINKLREI